MKYSTASESFTLDNIYLVTYKYSKNSRDLSHCTSTCDPEFRSPSTMTPSYLKEGRTIRIEQRILVLHRGMFGVHLTHHLNRNVTIFLN